MTRNLTAACLALSFLLASLPMGTTGCISGSNGGATTQPAADPHFAQFLAEIAIDDALIVAAGNPKLQPYIDAAQKAKADLENAPAGTPDIERYIKAANTMAVTLIVETGKAKAAEKAAKAAAAASHPATKPSK